MGKGKVKKERGLESSLANAGKPLTFRVRVRGRAKVRFRFRVRFR